MWPGSVTILQLARYDQNMDKDEQLPRENHQDLQGGRGTCLEVNVYFPCKGLEKECHGEPSAASPLNKWFSAQRLPQSFRPLRSPQQLARAALCQLPR